LAPIAARCEELPQSAPKVSICIPVYNVEPWLPAALDSAVNQTLKDIEIICVDDGSSDGSLAILNSYAARDSRIKVLSNDVNRGTSYARMRAILESKGDYILWLDADDELFLDIAEKAYSKAVATGADIVVFNSLCFDAKNKIFRTNNLRTMAAKTGSIESGIEFIDIYLAGNVDQTCWGKLWKAANMREMATYLLPFVAENKIFKAEDMMYFWYAAKYTNSYVASPCNGYKHFEYRGISARNKNDISHKLDVAINLINIERKILADETTKEMRDKARRFCSGYDDSILSTACQLPRPEGFELVEKYLSSVPPPYDGEIANKMRRKNRKFFDDYKKYLNEREIAQRR
jgi:glycosyltransferase involved in cell wall biosynthesis